MWVTPLELIQILSRRMRVGWPKCGSDPRDEGHLACLLVSRASPSLVKGLARETILVPSPSKGEDLHSSTFAYSYIAQ